MDQLRLAENSVPLKIGNKRTDILNPGRAKRHLSLESHQIERWNSEERLSINWIPIVSYSGIYMGRGNNDFVISTEDNKQTEHSSWKNSPNFLHHNELSQATIIVLLLVYNLYTYD